MDQLIDDDAKRMRQLLQQSVEELAEDHLLSETEIEQLVHEVAARADKSWLRCMYKAGTSAGFPDDACREFAYKTFDVTCLEITRKRERVALPLPAEVQSVIDLLAEKVPEEKSMEEVRCP